MKTFKDFSDIPRYKYKCRFCNTLMTYNPVSAAPTLTIVMECNQCKETSGIYGIYYKFRLDSPLFPTLYQIDMYLNAIGKDKSALNCNLMIQYRPAQYLKDAMTPKEETLSLNEKVINHNVLYQNSYYSSWNWKTIANLPINLISKPLQDIINRIETLKPFI